MIIDRIWDINRFADLEVSLSNLLLMIDDAFFHSRFSPHRFDLICIHFMYSFLKGSKDGMYLCRIMIYEGRS